MIHERGVNCRSKDLNRQAEMGCSVQLEESALGGSWDKLFFVVNWQEKIWVRLQVGGIVGVCGYPPQNNCIFSVK